MATSDKDKKEDTTQAVVDGGVEGGVPEIVDERDKAGKGFTKPEDAPDDSETVPETPTWPVESVTLVEPTAKVSGYVADPESNPKERPYLVHNDSALAGGAWNVVPGTIQGRSGNPGLTDDARKELGLDKK